MSSVNWIKQQGKVKSTEAALKSLAAYSRGRIDLKDLPPGSYAGSIAEVQDNGSVSTFQRYKVLLFSGPEKVSSEITLEDCQVVDDTAPALEEGDKVLVVVRPDEPSIISGGAGVAAADSIIYALPFGYGSNAIRASV